MTFQKGHKQFKGVEKGWFKKGDKAHLGIKHSEETRQKMRKASKHIKYWLGKKRPPPSKETRKKMRENNAHYWLGKQKLFLRGDKNPNWKGGISSENEKIRKRIKYHLWRKAVFAYDNWACWICEIRGIKLYAHHLKNFAEYPDLRLKKSNGLTLCKFCHKTYTDFGAKARK